MLNTNNVQIKHRSFGPDVCTSFTPSLVRHYYLLQLGHPYLMGFTRQVTPHHNSPPPYPALKLPEQNSTTSTLFDLVRINHYVFLANWCIRFMGRFFPMLPTLATHTCLFTSNRLAINSSIPPPHFPPPPPHAFAFTSPSSLK